MRFQAAFWVCRPSENLVPSPACGGGLGWGGCGSGNGCGAAARRFCEPPPAPRPSPHRSAGEGDRGCRFHALRPSEKPFSRFSDGLCDFRLPYALFLTIQYSPASTITADKAKYLTGLNGPPGRRISSGLALAYSRGMRLPCLSSSNSSLLTDYMPTSTEWPSV